MNILRGLILSRSITVALLAASALISLRPTSMGQAVATQPAAQDANAPSTSPEKWESSIKAFEQKFAAGESKPGSILFLGSSSIRKWDLPKWFPHHQTVNHGFGGSEISDSIHFFDRVVTPVKPSLILFYAGDNDLSRGKSAEVVHRDFTSFVKLVQQKVSPETTICFIAIKPSIKRWNLRDEISKANALIAKDCDSNERLKFVDIWTPMIGEDGTPKPEIFEKDELHLNDKGYTIWTEVISRFLPPALPGN